jgi:hypothetical protein
MSGIEDLKEPEGHLVSCSWQPSPQRPATHSIAKLPNMLCSVGARLQQGRFGPILISPRCPLVQAFFSLLCWSKLSLRPGYYQA